MGKVGIALIGPSGTGKTTIGKILARELGMSFHDMDDDGLEGSWGVGGVARVLSEYGDEGFLERESTFVIESYGEKNEVKKYTLNGMIFATAGSLVLETAAIEYIRERMITIHLDLPESEIIDRAEKRGVSRIVGMNGEHPRFASLREVLEYRRNAYERYADLTFPLTPGESPESDADRLVEYIEKYIGEEYALPSLLHDSRTGEVCSLRQAVLTSQPYSGGLWCPREFPTISLESIGSLVGMSYQEVAETILGSWSWGIGEADLHEIIHDAYGSQWHREEITPVKHITENLYSLHLGYGPTFAFKNIALEFLPRLLSRLSKGQKIHVLGASSGDTINAAHSGVRGTNIFSLFMLPDRGPSAVQKLQAIAGIRDNPNAYTLLAKAPFDPLQDIVKKVNSPEYRETKEQYQITSFNSINIARILAQSVYYFRAYAEIVRMGKISLGKKVIFSVPSGNFGDALAGYYALRMGLPIEKIHIATNENDMLHHFFETGRYEPPKKGGTDFVQVTNAPSMDIAKSSNFERMLYDMVAGDSEKVANWYQDLREKGYFEVDSTILSNIRDIFTSSRSTDAERLETIRHLSEEYDHGVDPHTSSALTPWRRGAPGVGIYRQGDTPFIFLETSHIAQFRDELRGAGIEAPGMHEFDPYFETLEERGSGENVRHTGSDFEEIFPHILDILEVSSLPLRGK